MNLPWSYENRAFYIDIRRDANAVYLMNWDFIPLKDLCSFKIARTIHDEKLFASFEDGIGKAKGSIPSALLSFYPDLWKDFLKRLKKAYLEKGIMFTEDEDDFLCNTMEGRKFGKLLVLGRAEGTSHGISYNCRCDCGNFKVVAGGNLRKGNTSSCGCSKTKKLYDFEGERTTLGKVSKKVGININTLKNRMSKGMSLQEAASFKSGLKGKAPKIFTVDGRSGSLRDLSEFYGIRENTVRQRMHNGMSVEQALTAKLTRGKEPKRYDVHGESLTLKEMSDKYDLPLSLLQSRIHNNKFSAEDAVSKKLQKKKYRVKVLFEGKRRFLADVCKSQNADLTLVHNRLNRGWPVKDALNLPKGTNIVSHYERIRGHRH